MPVILSCQTSLIVLSIYPEIDEIFELLKKETVFLYTSSVQLNDNMQTIPI